MLILIVVGLSASLGALVVVQSRRWPQADPSVAASVELGNQLRRREHLQRFLRARVDPGPATGLALTLGLAVVVVAGVAVGLLAYLLRTYPRLAAADLSVARWAAGHATPSSTAFLKGLTSLGSTVIVIVVGAVCGIVTSLRSRSAMPIAFMTVALAGESIIVHLIKVLVGRARPTISVLTGFHGQSFPSGHSAAAAACYGAVALLLARHLSPRARSTLYGVAVALAVAVACSRVFLGVHWVSDVIAGLAVGWGWLALTSIAFGGRFLVFGAPVEVAAIPVTHPSPGDRARQPTSQ